jgi:hypothetical protein
VSPRDRAAQPVRGRTARATERVRDQPRAVRFKSAKNQTDWPRNLNSACLGPFASRRPRGGGHRAFSRNSGRRARPTSLLRSPLHSGTDFADHRNGATPGRDPLGAKRRPSRGGGQISGNPSATAASAGSRRSPTSQPQRGEECRKPRGIRSVNEQSVVNPEGAGRAKAGPAWYLSPRELSALLFVAPGPAPHQSALSRVSRHPCCARLTQQLQRAPQALYPQTPPFS